MAGWIPLLNLFYSGNRSQQGFVLAAESKCAMCGACTVVCPVFRVDCREALTARGKLHLLGTGLGDDPSAHFEDIFSRCLLCGACEFVCPRDMEITKKVIQARSDFSLFYGQHGVRKTLARLAVSKPGLLELLAEGGLYLKKIAALPLDSGLRLKLGILEERLTQAKSEPAWSEAHRKGTQQDEPKALVPYFSGCLARHLQPSIGLATDSLLTSLSTKKTFAPAEQCCCGLAAHSAGKVKEARRLAQQNIATFELLEGPILTSCASCSAMLTRYPQLFKKDSTWYRRAKAFGKRVVEFSEYFCNLGEDKKLVAKDDLKVLYHNPCHLRFSSQGGKAALVLLGRVEEAVVVEPEGGPHCCGQGGLFNLAYPKLSEQIFQKCFAAATKSEPDIVVTSCSGCLMQWQLGLAARKSGVRAIHLAVFLSNALRNVH